MGPDDSVAQRAPSHDRFPCFDGVRALAALMVVVYHAVFFNTDFLTRGGAFLGTLNAGVWIFFVTSGCLLYLPFAASHLGDASGVDPRGYAVRRLARVYPAYWLVLAFFTFIVPRVNIYGLHGFLLHTTLTQTYVHINPFVDGLPPAWSLVVEISFYLFLPFYAALIGALARRSRPLAVEFVGLAVLFAVGIIAIVAVAAGLDAPWVTVLPQHLGAFALGMLLAVLSSRRWDASTTARLEHIGRPTWMWWTVALVALVAIPVGLRLDPLAAPNTAQAIGRNLCQMLIGICVVVPVVLGPQDHGAIRRLLRSRVAVYLGLVSYGIYLWHWYLLRIVADWLGWPLNHGNYLVVFTLALPIVVFAASLSWFGLERPVLRLAHRIAPGGGRATEPKARDRHALHDA
ncbi:MAG: acyltransferase [Actinomycetota bacterium]|nr:acyltransferase [Actinomycetota bacterium]